MAVNRVLPGPGQESVWDYPRPPRVELSSRSVRVEFAGELIAQSMRSHRVLETSHPPSWYVPRQDVRFEFFTRTAKRSYCEWKGVATYYSLSLGGQQLDNIAWSYEDPTPAFGAIRDSFSFYPNVLDCFIDEKRVLAQPGGFYGGWITPDVVGPFKGGPGSLGW